MILAVPILLKVDGLFIINIINLDLVDRDIGVAGRTAGLQIQINGAAYLSDQFICFCVSGKIVIVRITVSTKLTTTSANVITVIRFFFMIDLSNYLKILN